MANSDGNSVREQSSSRIAKVPMKKLIWQLGLPMIISMVLQAVYNIVDTVFVVKSSAGTAGNLALTYAFPVQILMIAVGVGTGIGINALLGKSLGENNKEVASRTCGNGIFLMIVLYIAFMLFGIFGAEWFIKMQADETSIYYESAVFMGTTYLRICCVLSVGSIGFAVFERFLQATGKTTLSMTSQCTGAALNIILDYVFIYPCDMGVEGAAWATIIGQIASLCLAMVFHYATNKGINKSLKYIKPSWNIIKGIYKTGLSAAIMQGLLSVMMLGMNLILGTAAGVADTLVGSFGIYYKIMQFALFAFFGISNTIITILSFNYGMGDKERCKQAILWGIIDCVIVAVVVTVLFEALATPFASLFSATSVDADEKTMGVVETAIRISAIGYVFMAFSVAVQGVLQAFRYAIRPLIISLLRLVVFVFPLAYVFTLTDNPLDNVWWSLVICEVLTAVVTAFILWDTYRRKIVPMQSAKKAEEGNLIVTISREHGSHGKYIGSLVAKKLGIGYYDKEIAAKVAEDSGLAGDFIGEALDGETRLKNTYLSTEPNRQAIIEQAKVIRKIADTESCVIVGRGADFILKDYYDCIKIFIYADESFKVNMIKEMYGDDEASARKHMEQSDVSRKNYYNFISGHDWGDKNNYDLCVNSSVGAEETADIIVSYVQKHSKNLLQQGEKVQAVSEN
ncbi:MAG: MATE family efflux transporter [Clostridia bacterium]|nr:MATE family efflux transporter [Clostridia bacterium]